MSEYKNNLELLDTSLIDYLIRKKLLTASAYIDFFKEYLNRHTIETVLENMLEIYEGFSIILTNAKKQYQKSHNDTDTTLYIEDMETKWINANAKFIEDNLYKLNQQNSLVELTEDLQKFLNKFITDWQRIYSIDLQKNIYTAKNMSEIALLLGGTSEENKLPTSEDVMVMYENKIMRNLNFIEGYQELLISVFKTNFLDEQLETIKNTLKNSMADKINLFDKFDSIQDNLSNLSKDTVNKNVTFEKLPSLSKIDKDGMFYLIEKIYKYADTDKEKLLLAFLKKYKLSNEANLKKEINILLTLTRFKYLKDAKVTKNSTLYLEIFKSAYMRSLQSQDLLLNDFRKEYPFFPFTEKTPYEMYMKMGEIFKDYGLEKLPQMEAEQFAKSLQFGLLLDMKDLEGMEVIFEKEINRFVQNELTDLFKLAGFNFKGNTSITLGFLDALEEGNKYYENGACYLFDYLKRTDNKVYSLDNKGKLDLRQLDKGKGNTLSNSLNLKALELLYLLIEKDYSPISKEDFFTRVSLIDIPKHYIDGSMKNRPISDKMKEHVEYRLKNAIYTKEELMTVCNAPKGKLHYRATAEVIRENYGTQISDTFQVLLNQSLTDGSLNIWDKQTSENLAGLSGELIIKAFETMYPVHEVTHALQIYNDYCNTVAVEKYQFIYLYFKMIHLKS